VEQIRSHIQGIVKGLLDGVQPDGDREPGKIDVITDLAYPLPAIVIAEMLGAEPKDRDQFKKWSDDLAAFLGNIRIVSETYESAMKSVAELIDYLRELVAQRRKEPKDDLISALVMAEDQGDSFTQEELFSMCVLLIFAGHETTTNLIGNGILAPLNNPSELAKLRQNPSLIVPAIEEIIRYDGPVQTTTRTALEPLEIGGKQIAKGDRISLTLGAANRDPAQFPDPDRMDITRGENRHVGFGFGIHFCLGAALARMESQLAIGAMVERMPELRLESADLVWRDNPILRGVNSLPVAF
jgi:cytochrome P450